MRFRKKKILIFVDWFLPGYKAGGPIRSISNLIDHLADEFDFHIVTSDRDLGDQDPYENVIINDWIEKSKYHLIYLSKINLKGFYFKKLYTEINPDFVYINSLFSYSFAILPIRCLSSFNPIIYLSPRGMLGEKSLEIEPLKKKVFLFLANAINLYKNINWIASNEIEKQQVISNFGTNLKLFVMPNLAIKQFNSPDSFLMKNKGILKLIYVCRISPIKNIDFLIGLLNSLKGEVLLTIAGPIEDELYWEKCLDEINLLNGKVAVEHLGEMSPSDIHLLFKSHHCFISSSFNENYGHSIVESLSFGCPVIVSEHTPWRQLEDSFAGFSLELNDVAFIEKIQFFIDMNNQMFLKYRMGAFEYFKKKIDLDTFKDNYREIFS